MTTTTTTWNEAEPRRADNVEIAPRISEDWLSLIIGPFVLGYIWTNHINRTGDKASAWEIWQRFPKFVIGFLITFVVGLYLALATPADIAAKVPAAMGEAVYFVSLFGFVIWVGLLISWLFFSGVKPPLAS
jgi:hypothetical protein